MRSSWPWCTLPFTEPGGVFRSYTRWVSLKRVSPFVVELIKWKISYLNSGLKVVVPSGPIKAKGLLLACIKDKVRMRDET